MALQSTPPNSGDQANAYHEIYNTVNQMAHPVDRGNPVEGYTSGTFQSTTAGYSSNAAGDFPFGQVFSDPAPLAPTTANVMQWRGGCRRQLPTATGSHSDPLGEATAPTWANGTPTWP